MGVNVVDYGELLEPYQERRKQSDKIARTPEGLRRWLLGLQPRFSEAIVDTVMASVFSELATGKTFENGRALDFHLKRRCYDAADRINKKQIDYLQAVQQSAMENYLMAAKALQRPSSWLRQPLTAIGWYRREVSSLLIGLLVGAGGAWICALLLRGG